MSEKKVFNRWWVVAGALIIQVSLGAVYIWSVFQTPLRNYFETWTETQVTLPAQIVLASFAIAVILGGRFQDKFGPRIVATTGGLILGAGLILARFTGNFADHPVFALTWLILTFAVLGGIGIGVAYVCPIATCVKWFPDKRGLITGLAVAGFGAGAFFFAPLAGALITGSKYQLFNIPFFGVPEVGVFNAFMILGIIFLVAVVGGAQLLKNPPPGYQPEGWEPPVATQENQKAVQADYSPTEMLKTPAFWVLWITFFAGCTAGLQIIMKASPIWESFALGGFDAFIPESKYLAAGAAGATAVSVLAIFNSLGRIIWGKISDIIERKTTLFIMFVLCGAAMLMLNVEWMRPYPLYLLGISIIGLCFGGFLSLYPALTADYFGTKHIGVNYGWMFTAFGAGGIFGPFLAAWLMNVEETVSVEPSGIFEVVNYGPAFWVAGIFCLIAAVLILKTKKPEETA